MELSWLPHLRRLAVELENLEAAEALDRVLPGLTCLSHLAFVDDFSMETLDDEERLQLPELQSLPALVELQCVRWVPPEVKMLGRLRAPCAASVLHLSRFILAPAKLLQVWYLEHLTALTCWDTWNWDAAGMLAPSEMQLQRLQRLQLRACSFATDHRGRLRRQLCIPELTSLLWMDDPFEEWDDTILPRQFFKAALRLR